VILIRGYLAMFDKARDALKLLNTEQLRAAAVVLPLAGTLAAITFEAGYFRGVELFFYFSVFSLVEHVDSLLQILPVAMAIISAYSTILAFIIPVMGHLVLVFCLFLAILISLTFWWLSGLTVILWIGSISTVML